MIVLDMYLRNRWWELVQPVEIEFDPEDAGEIFADLLLLPFSLQTSQLASQTVATAMLNGETRQMMIRNKMLSNCVRMGLFNNNCND